MPVALRVTSAALAAACLLLVAGCGTPSGTATGSITLDSAPVSGAEIGFESQDDPKRQVFGTSAADGRYTLNYPNGKGIAAGKYTVMITRYTLPNGKPLPPGEKGAALRAEDGKTAATTYYFEAEVREGSNTLNFELNTGKATKPGS